MQVIVCSGSDLSRRTAQRSSGAIVTRPTAPDEGETHWELEASSGDGNFYVIATTAIATTTVTDTINPSTGYASAGDLSEDIGDYTLIESPKYIKTDQDRLILGGSWFNSEHGSRVSWTPVWADPGFANDERIPADVDSFIDLDWMDGGELTDLSDPVNGSFYAFKWNRIYKFQRTGDNTRAYDAFLLSNLRGAIYNSVVSGIDEFGKGCIYFLDPSIGPMRVGSQGLQQVKNIGGTWKMVNTNAADVICHGIYYPDKQQIKWWLATSDEDTPNLIITLHVNEIRTTDDGTQRGWATANGTIATALCSTILPLVIDDPDTGAQRLSFRPFLGLASPDYVQQGDVGDTDNGDTYIARIVTKPMILGSLVDRFGVMNMGLMAAANDDDTVAINIKLIRDFGVEESDAIPTDFVPENGEETVIKSFDNLFMSGARAIQVEITDA
jgi:hypothetical protein